MSLKTTYTAPRPITCTNYVAAAGSRRCENYVDGGACRRPDEFMCVEWLKRNGGQQAAAQAPEAQPPAAPVPASATVTPFRPRVVDGAASSKAPEVFALRKLSVEEVASFKGAAVEVCIAAPGVGDLWIVPAYTGQDRQEISVDHLSVLAAILAAFPGSSVTKYVKTAPAAEKTARAVMEG